MPTIGLTIARRVDDAWECVDDFGRRIEVPDASIDTAVRELRVGQRLLLAEESGRRVARFP